MEKTQKKEIHYRNELQRMAEMGQISPGEYLTRLKESWGKMTEEEKEEDYKSCGDID